MKPLIGFLGVLAMAGLMFFKAADTITLASANIAKHGLDQRAALGYQPP